MEDEFDIEDILSGLGYEEDDDLELSGYGEEIMGATPRRRFGRRAAIRKVRNRQMRRYPLGLGVTSVPAGGTAIIRANPQLPFKLERLVSPSLGLSIDNLQVGTVSQFVAAGAVPTEAFAPDAVAVQLAGDTAVPGVDIAITVSNPTVGAINFSGVIIGLVAQ